jgi:cytosine/adenosine deaminase-related metal-dependent hydrolase
VILYRARWVVPIAEPPIEDGVVGVAGGRITFVGLRADAPAGTVEDLGDVILVPGLVNAHCHLELTAMRGFLEDLEFRRWILRLNAGRRAVLDRAALLDSARLGVEEGVRAGITTYADTSESGVPMQALRDAGVRGIVYQEVFGPDPVQCDASMAGLTEKVSGLLYLETTLVRVGVSPHAPYTVSDPLFRATARFAREQRLPMAVHIAEGELESHLVVRGAGAFADSLRQRGIDVRPRARSPIQLLADLGVLEAKPLLIHCVRVDAIDVATIADTTCAVAHCPASNAKLGHGIAPLTQLMAAGVVVGLGSDSVASSNRMDILEEARFALLAQRVVVGSAETPSAQDVLDLATIEGARALGLDDEIGTLEVGKSADLAAFTLDPTYPVQDPVAALVFSTSGARARFVAVAGRPLLRDGMLVNPTPGLASRVQRSADALRDWLAGDGELMTDLQSRPIANSQ